MLQNRSDNFPKQSIIYSILVHAVTFAFGLISSIFTPKNDNPMLTDIEIASEGELQQEIDNNQEELPKVEHEEAHEKEVKHENLDQNQNIDQEEQLKEVPLHPKEEPVKEDIPTESEEKEAAPPVADEPNEEIAAEEKPSTDEPSKAEDPKKEIVEEPAPKLSDEKPKKATISKNNEPENSKPKRRNRKILMDVIKASEKRKVKYKNRKKLLEIAEKISKKKKNSAFDKMLNGSINDLNKTAGKGNNSAGTGSFGSGNSVTTGFDYEMISSQIYPHWSVPSGVRDAGNIIIEIKVELKDSGEIIPSSIKILDEKRYEIDYTFRAAADSARRAILEASPLEIPKNKIELFRNFVLRFNLKEALGE